VRDLAPILARQQEYIDRLATEHPVSYRSKLLRLVQRNGSSLFTARNEVTILQDASQKYPRLMHRLPYILFSRHEIPELKYFVPVQ